MARAKLSNLSSLKKTAVDADTPATVEKSSEKKTKVRANQYHVGGYYSKDVHRQVKMIALENDRSIQSVLAEALNLLFATYGKPEIADDES